MSLPSVQEFKVAGLVNGLLLVAGGRAQRDSTHVESFGAGITLVGCLLGAEATVQEMLSQSAVEALEEKEHELSFSTAMCALTILRYAATGQCL